MNACISFVNEHYNNNPVIMQNVNNYVVYHLLLIAVNYCYNPNNKNKYKQKLLKDICNLDIYKNAINKSDYQDLSLTRKITLFTIKTKLYFITGLICRIRQIGLKGN